MKDLAKGAKCYLSRNLAYGAGELASKGGPTHHHLIPTADQINCATRLKDGVVSQYGATAFCGGQFRLNNCVCWFFGRVIT